MIVPIAGGPTTGVNVKPPGAEGPAGVVTTTSTAPGAWPGVVTVIVVSSTTVTFAPGVPPKVTPVAPVKPLPVMVTAVPPVSGPLAGVTEVMTGSGR